ncbi:transmembrane reductase CYB561D2-like [Cylas formicarius]|uniref:transmembrane reductase CYB561D2-like n=1 Tax=Cylas formicarius TaxID=197179 RepID=UPI0029585D1B|nr:transmembrane reductase CYB561D2-like [Cylas formicarius]
MSVFHEPVSNRSRLLFAIQGVFQMLLAVFVGSTVWLMAYSRDWGAKATWHIFLTTIGFALLMAEAVSLLNEGNVFYIGVNKLRRGLIHGTYMFLATLSAVIGIGLKIQEKSDRGSKHFTSTHGKLGIAALVLTITACLGGLGVLNSSRLYRAGIKPKWVRVLHILISCFAYLIGCVALGYGIDSYFGEATADTKKGLITVLGLYVVISLSGPANTLYSIFV